MYSSIDSKCFLDVFTVYRRKEHMCVRLIVLPKEHSYPRIMILIGWRKVLPNQPPDDDACSRMNLLYQTT
jgi:hypothetical protein